MSSPKLNPSLRFNWPWFLLIPLLLLRCVLYIPPEPPIGKTVKVVDRVTKLVDQNITKYSFYLGKIQVFTELFPLVSCGQKITAVGKLESRLIGGGGQTFVLRDPKISIIDPRPGGGLPVLVGCRLAAIGELLKQLSSRVLVGQPLALISGLVWGKTAGIVPEFLRKMQKTGTIHLLAASGYNVGLIFGLGDLIGRSFLSWRTRIMTGLLAIWAYVGLAGGELSLVRAAVMISLVLLARLTGRRRTDFRVLVLAGWLMAMFSPRVLTDLSFQLSFASTAGILLGNRIRRTVSKPSFLIQAWRLGWWAQLGVLPILWYHFQEFAWLGLVVNPFVGWLVPLLTIGGIFLPWLGIISAWLGRLIVFPIWVLARLFIGLIDFFARLPIEPLKLNRLPFWLAVGYYLLLGAYFYQKTEYEE